MSGIIDRRLTTCCVLQKLLGSQKVRFAVFCDIGYIAPCTTRDLRIITKSSSIALAHSKPILAHGHI